MLNEISGMLLRNPGPGKGKYHEAFGKNEQVKRVFWTLFVVMAGLVLARVLDTVTAQQIVGMIRGWGCEEEDFHFLIFL